MRIGAIVLVVLLLFPVASLGRALTEPGAAPLTVRTVDWVRDHGGGPIVDAIENWFYSRHHAADVPPTPSELPVAPRTDRPDCAGRSACRLGPPPGIVPVSPALHPLPAEGRWRLGRLSASGKPAMWTTYFRPQPRYPGMLAAVAEFPRGRTTAHLVAGTIEPGVGHWPGSASVPARQVPSLVAIFNGGWRFRDARGGFMIGDRADPPMINGLATAVITESGQLQVRRWSSGARLPDIAAARQNLHLIVDHGQPVAGLSRDNGDLWGSAHNQLQYTARTGLGVDAAGDAIFIAGTNMNLTGLALAFQKVHAITAMELDIHPSITFFTAWKPDPRGINRPTKLLPTMHRSPDRFLKPDQRDFFYLTLPGPKVS
ncbi:phosphodiester glycosidase family protein [Microlunatus elymi]|uniref:Phosphodiester glycosidase family protein n=1 Tax=Microlunatus elymi TaxID=2596828 RepID=A0A516PYB4_9ACTN|nr:phosphodiester glycosidase family protein [Microlunatus elymi]QDP96165.1 phosphodiester glycosidase family protein [Microlunatus elymi]